MNPLACPSCGFANEDNRVFCQNCGTRLEVSAKAGTPPPAGHAARPSSSPYGRSRPPIKERQKSHARKPGALALIIAVVRTLVIAALIAATIQIFRPPDGIPVKSPASEPLASRLAADMHAASENNYPRSMELPVADVNNFLASRISGRRGAMGATLARCYTAPKGDLTRFGIEQRVAKYPVYLEMVLKPLPARAGTSAEVVAGSIGRLPVPAPLLPLFRKSFSPVFEALRGPRGWLESATSITTSPDGWVVQWPGTGER
ncbi:MAG: hypothetical protein Fur0032_14920 [Terrimicrobiaceae bacterium]